MSWLLRDGDVLAAIEDPRKGWHRSLQGAMLLPRPAMVHTLVDAVALDVAWCGPATGGNGEPGFRVRRIAELPPRRLARPHLGAGALLVAPGGTFERWRLHVGDRLEVRGE
jgi:hypothetical protein